MCVQPWTLICTVTIHIVGESVGLGSGKCLKPSVSASTKLFRFSTGISTIRSVVAPEAGCLATALPPNLTARYFTRVTSESNCDLITDNSTVDSGKLDPPKRSSMRSLSEFTKGLRFGFCEGFSCREAKINTPPTKQSATARVAATNSNQRIGCSSSCQRGQIG